MTVQHDDSYELFQRAIVDRDAEAWATVHARYHRMLIVWASRSSARSDYSFDSSEIADQAFARAWMALTPERFGNFPTLARLLSYLRACVATTVIDTMRQRTICGHDLDEMHADMSNMPEQTVLAEMERTALWGIVLSAAATQAEWVALVEGYAYGLPPRAIYARHASLFASVVDVYTAKRNLLNRLQRNHELRQLYEEFV